MAPGAGNLTQVASFAHQVTGITVSRDGRIFVNFPRWSEDAPVSVAELKDGKPVAYPNDDWNSWRMPGRTRSIPRPTSSASRASSPTPRIASGGRCRRAGHGTCGQGRSQARRDRSEDQSGREDDPVRHQHGVQASYINDVRISPDGKTAYLTDSGAEGALIVVDLDSGSAKRVLSGHPSTMPDKSVTCSTMASPCAVPTAAGSSFRLMALRSRRMARRSTGRRSRARRSIAPDRRADRLGHGVLRARDAERQDSQRKDRHGRGERPSRRTVDLTQRRADVRDLSQDNAVKVRDLSKANSG